MQNGPVSLGKESRRKICCGGERRGKEGQGREDVEGPLYCRTGAPPTAVPLLSLSPPAQSKHACLSLQSGEEDQSCSFPQPQLCPLHLVWLKLSFSDILPVLSSLLWPLSDSEPRGLPRTMVKNRDEHQPVPCEQMCPNTCAVGDPIAAGRHPLPSRSGLVAKNPGRCQLYPCSCGVGVSGSRHRGLGPGSALCWLRH